MGAMIVSDRVAEPFVDGGEAFAHGLTFGGHPVAAAVALAEPRPHRARGPARPRPPPRARPAGDARGALRPRRSSATCAAPATSGASSSSPTGTEAPLPGRRRATSSPTACSAPAAAPPRADLPRGRPRLPRHPARAAADRRPGASSPRSGGSCASRARRGRAPGRAPVTAATRAARRRRRSSAGAPSSSTCSRRSSASTRRAPGPDLAPREEAALQAHLAERLRSRRPRRRGVGARRRRPAADALPDPARPPLPRPPAARRAPRRAPAAGAACCSTATSTSCPRSRASSWTTDPFRADVRDGRLYGRGACDMKGGVAAMVFATEVLATLDVPLRGELLVNTVTDEESTGRGLARLRRARRRAPTARSSPSRPR